MAHFKWHTKPIVSVEWHPSDETALMVAGADDLTTLWDMSVEADTDAAVTGSAAADTSVADLPPQLMFVHQVLLLLINFDGSSVLCALASHLPPPTTHATHPLQGQEDVKEVHHHPQIPGMCITTAVDSFNFFMPNLTPGVTK